MKLLIHKRKRNCVKEKKALDLKISRNLFNPYCTCKSYHLFEFQILYQKYSNTKWLLTAQKTLLTEILHNQFNKQSLLK